MRCPLPASKRSVSRVPGWWWCLAAVAAFLLTTAGVRSAVPLRDAFPGGAKLEYYLLHRGEYDVLLVGNSLIYRAIIPALFDARMAEHGYPIRSYNFGFSGMRAFETDHLVRFLARSGDLPPHVFLGPGPFDPHIEPWERRTHRAVAWHSPRQTVAALRTVWRPQEPWPERARLAADHSLLFSRWLTRFGDGGRILGAVVEGGEATAAELEVLSRTSGYEGLEGLDRRPIRARHRRFLRRQKQFLAAVARNSRRRHVNRLTAMNLERLAGLGAFVRRTGSRPVLLISPNKARLAGFTPDGAGETLLLNFDDPVRYPRLFDLDMRFDSSHLNRRGAEIYTRLVADAFAAGLAREGD